MKKLFIIITSLFLLSGCIQTTKPELSENVGFFPVQSENDNMNFSLKQENDEYTPVEIITKNNKCIYENNECGYSITFPAEWAGWFNIYEFDSFNGQGKRTEIWFMAKSDTYSLGLLSKGVPMGMPIFYIINDYVRKNATLDSVIFLGKTDTDEFYSATGTSSPWGVPIYPNGTELTQTEKQTFNNLSNKVNLTEEEAQQLDRLKVIDMSKDILTILDSWVNIQ